MIDGDFHGVAQEVRPAVERAARHVEDHLLPVDLRLHVGVAGFGMQQDLLFRNGEVEVHARLRRPVFAAAGTVMLEMMDGRLPFQHVRMGERRGPGTEACPGPNDEARAFGDADMVVGREMNDAAFEWYCKHIRDTAAGLPADRKPLRI